MYTRTRLTLFVLGGLLALSTGCHHAFTNSTHVRTAWPVDETTRLALCLDVSSCPPCVDNEPTYRQITLFIEREGRIVHRQIRCRQQRDDLPAGHDCAVNVDKTVLRVTPDREQCWLVDTNSQQVVAAYDRTQQAVTIYADPPRWPADRTAEVVSPVRARSSME